VAHQRSRRSGRRAGSFRTCVACRRRMPLGQSARVVLGPEGQILPDLSGRLPGHGAHLCLEPVCFARAFQQNAFGRAFKRAVPPAEPTELLLAFANASRAKVASLLATALRSGWLVAGRDEVHRRIHRSAMALVLLAGDTAADTEHQTIARAEARRIPWRRIESEKRELASFHRGKAVAVLGVWHRGLADRLQCEIDRIVSLTKVCELTGGKDRGKIPRQLQ